jgi:hypothetical protein
MILRKEDKTMNYTKPELNTLGNASEVIEKLNNKTSAPPIEGVGDPHPGQPAYDLDE